MSVDLPRVNLAAPSGPAPKGANGPETAESRQAMAKQFEALLLSELVKAMRATTSFGGDEDDAFAQGTYQEMFDQAIVDGSAGGLGIGDAMTRQMAGAQVANPGAGFNPLGPRRLPGVAAIPLSVPNRRPIPEEETPAMPVVRASDAPSGPIGSVFAGGAPTPGLWPVDGGAESSGYGFRTHPIHGERRFHGGLDIAAPEGREIRVVQGGEVVFAGRHKGYGNMVEVRHDDGIVTRYAHASRLHVREGDRVEVGEAIADVGSTGQSTGPHLHFEVRDGARTLNPHAYLEKLRRAAEHTTSAAARPRVGVRPWDTTLARSVK